MDVRSGHNAEGFYAQLNGGDCYFAVQRFANGVVQLDTYRRPQNPTARCERSASREVIKGALLVSS
jgi:hypothetical protein